MCKPSTLLRMLNVCPELQLMRLSSLFILDACQPLFTRSAGIAA